jgi:hypothetical protein
MIDAKEDKVTPRERMEAFGRNEPERYNLTNG